MARRAIFSLFEMLSAESLSISFVSAFKRGAEGRCVVPHVIRGCGGNYGVGVFFSAIGGMDAL